MTIIDRRLPPRAKLRRRKMKPADCEAMSRRVENWWMERKRKDGTMKKPNQGFGYGSRHTVGQLQRMSAARQERPDMTPRSKPSLPVLKCLQRPVEDDADDAKR